MFEKLVKWYVEDRTKWVNGIVNMPEHYSTHLVVDPDSIKKSIRENMKYYLELGVKNGELKHEDVDILLSNSSLIKEFVESVFLGFKENFPLVKKNSSMG